jgi:transcriptional regulator with XRE-family HTH domain
MIFDQLSKAERAAMAERLKAARYMCGLSIRGAAEALGVNKNSVGDWEHGVLPEPPTRAKLAALYGVDDAVLFAEVAAHEAAAAELLRPA